MPPILIDVHTGQRLDSQPFDARHALASAAAWAVEEAAAESTQAPPAAVSYLGLVEEDAHTHSAALDAHRPLHHIQLHNAAGTQLYVSSRKIARKELPAWGRSVTVFASTTVLGR